MKPYLRVRTAVWFALLLGLVSLAHAAEKRVKVFILAGQSNMEVYGQVRSLDWLGKHSQYDHLLNNLRNEDGSWAAIGTPITTARRRTTA